MPIDWKKYPPDWDEIRERVLLRAGDQCEFCGLENGQVVYSVPLLVTDNKNLKPRMIWFSNPDDACRMVDHDETVVKQVRVVLTIVHLDHDEENWEVDDDRLMAGCQMCHLRYDIEEKKKRRNNA